MMPEGPTPSCVGRSSDFQVFTLIFGQPPHLCTLDGPTWPYSQRRKIRCKQTSQLSSTVPLGTYPIFKSRLLHTMASLHYQEPPTDIFPERVSTTPRKASLTRHGTRVNHACPPTTSSG